MSLIKFTRNYSDHSTDRGFQFEFFCDRCGTGVMTRFQASATGVVRDALDVAGDLLGGVFGRAASVGERVRSATWEKAWDKAFDEAIQDALPHFIQCPRCSAWVCRESCWNGARGLCKECAPLLETEMAAIQAEAAVEDAHEKARQRDYVPAEQFAEMRRAACPHCGAEVAGGKFCPECGKPLAADKFCTECGSKIAATVKFCPECGARQ